MTKLTAAQREFYQKSLAMFVDIERFGGGLSPLHRELHNQYAAILAEDEYEVPYDPNQQPDEEDDE